MNFYSYVIYNQEHHRFYYGFCQDVEKAVYAHNKGKVELTSYYSNWVMLFSEGFPTKQEAIRRSLFYRTAGGQRFLKKILNF